MFKVTGKHLSFIHNLGHLWVDALYTVLCLPHQYTEVALVAKQPSDWNMWQHYATELTGM